MDELSARRFGKANDPNSVPARTALDAAIAEYEGQSEYELVHAFVCVAAKKDGQLYHRFFNAGSFNYMGQMGLIELCKEQWMVSGK